MMERSFREKSFSGNGESLVSGEREFEIKY